MSRPTTGIMIYWRFKSSIPSIWHTGYTSLAGNGLIRMGRWNGDTYGGVVVDPAEIEWRHR